MQAVITETTNGFNQPLFLIGIADDQGRVIKRRYLLRGVFSKSTANKKRRDLQADIDRGLIRI